MHRATVAAIKVALSRENRVNIRVGKTQKACTVTILQFCAEDSRVLGRATSRNGKSAEVYSGLIGLFTFCRNRFVFIILVANEKEEAFIQFFCEKDLGKCTALTPFATARRVFLSWVEQDLQITPADTTKTGFNIARSLGLFCENFREECAVALQIPAPNIVRLDNARTAKRRRAEAKRLDNARLTKRRRAEATRLDNARPIKRRRAEAKTSQESALIAPPTKTCRAKSGSTVNRFQESESHGQSRSHSSSSITESSESADHLAWDFSNCDFAFDAENINPEILLADLLAGDFSHCDLDFDAENIDPEILQIVESHNQS